MEKTKKNAAPLGVTEDDDEDGEGVQLCAQQ
jgi:hypothetical protein